MKQIIKNSATSKIDNRLSYTSERYKGYLIVLDRGGDGYNVYDRHRELEDAGYPSKAAAKNFIDELVANDDVYSAHSAEKVDWYELDWDEQIQLIKNYIRQYKGSRIFEDFAEYINEPVEDIIDAFSDAEYRGDIRIPERMQLDSEYRNDDIYSSSDVKASEDDYNPYSFMVGDQLEWSGLYGGQYKGLVTNVNDEYVTVEVMRTAEDSGDTIIDTQKFEIVTDPEGKECIIVWTYGSHAGYVYPPYEGDPDDYIHREIDDSTYLISASSQITASEGIDEDVDALWEVIDDEDFEFRGVQDVGYDNDGNIMVIFNHYLSEDIIEPTAEELLIAFRQYGYPVHEWNTNGQNVFILSRGGILGSTDTDVEDEEDLPQAEQEYDSAKTSINSNKLPAIYNMITLPEGSVGIDYGGGKFDNAVEALAEQGVTLHVYDPYNRSQQHNRAAIKALRANGGADFAINSNVLNVIKEPEARLNVLENIKTITKPGAPIYITVYEGSGKGNEGVTKSGYQLNRKTADYLEEIQQVFPNAKRRGKLIVATNSRSVNSSTVNASDEGYVYTYCDGCGKKNRVKVTFNNFNEPFNDTEYKCKYCGTNNLLTDPHSYDENGNVVEASQSYLDRIEELMEQGLDEETASREAYAEFYPDEYDADDYDDSIYSSESSNVNNMKYWYFTKHGVQPGSIPKYVNVLDIIDKPEGSYFLTDNIINTNDLHEYEIKEAIPEDVDSCSEIEANYNVAIDKLHNELYNKIVKYGLSEGFPENEIDDYFFVTVMKAYDHIECEVRAEVDYEGLEALCDLLNPVVQKYEPAAYFEPVTSGIIEAYIYPTGKNKALFASKGSGDTHYMQLKRAYKNMRKFDDMDSQSADILDLEDELNSHNTPYERYEHTTDNGCTIFYDDYIKGQEFKNSDLTERETLYYKGKKFVVHYTVKDTYDAKEAFDSFKASISMIAPYDDADYYWARIYNGIIKYIYKGKVMRVNYYFNPEDMSDVDDWNLEDWYSGICDEVVQSLYESNKSIESKMVHN